MPNCKICGSQVPESQRNICSMCYGDIDYGRDGYYREWAEEQDRQAAERNAPEPDWPRETEQP